MSWAYSNLLWFPNVHQVWERRLYSWFSPFIKVPKLTPLGIESELAGDLSCFCLLPRLGSWRSRNEIINLVFLLLSYLYFLHRMNGRPWAYLQSASARIQICKTTVMFLFDIRLYAWPTPQNGPPLGWWHLVAFVLIRCSKKNFIEHSTSNDILWPSLLSSFSRHFWGAALYMILVVACRVYLCHLV